MTDGLDPNVILMGIKENTDQILVKVAVLETKEAAREKADKKRDDAITALDNWRQLHENQGRPPSRAAQLTAILVGQLLVGIGIAAAVMRAVG